ncbi:Murein DD-endopeptidase MepH precursor [compost metagenome]|uniref:C40 family peptidase n=1 Tax=Cupriavidus campinensis TaxID=151783 RepID=A0AAE9KZF2_9BURK|nr:MULTISPECIES: C40 family peptidase [Cupriavidus]TSP10628.1 NlpC/P60 family protein [Cupriavidus campinensis]URF02757.1 C40 family peptidase [Cupriavidus campinensis]
MPQRPLRLFSLDASRTAALAVSAAALLLAACAGGPPARQGASVPRAPGKPMIDPSAGLEEISIQAMSLVGTPYRYGGNTPDSGFDCSGLVRYVVQRAANVSLPRTTEQMGQRGSSLDRSQVASGDLVFFNTTGRANSHVGIYVGQNRFVHAPATGGTVRLEDMGKSYWASRYNGARRVVAASNLPMMPAPAREAPSPAPAPAQEDDDPIAAFARQ